ncbi:MAG: SAM-dependent methyltransferase [Candidatus Micrarchaeia archaeon]
MQQYLALNDSKFAGVACSELRQLLKSYNTEVRVDAAHGLITVSTDAQYETISSIISESVYVNAIMSVDAVTKAKECSDMLGALKEILSERQGSSFMLEVKKIKSSIGGNAKAIEVCLGKALEAQGMKADLYAPSIKIGVVLAGDNAYIGRLGKGMRLDYFRNSQNSMFLNRAEYKIAEAFESFGIKVNAGRALDIGAAPGGWTDFLLSNNLSVVAVDSAFLRYDRPKMHERTLVICKDGDALAPGEAARHGVECMPYGAAEDVSGIAEGYKLVHIKLPICKESIDMVKRMPQFDMLLIDANVAPEESAEFAKSMIACMRHGALAIITIKLIDNRIKAHVGNVLASISDSCSSMRLKKLPHNRKELTLFAVLK